MSDRLIYVILAFLFSIGLGLGAMAFGLHRLDREQERRFGSAEGTIAAIEHVRATPDGQPETIRDVPVLHFVTPDGHAWDVRSNVSVPTQRFLAGDHVRVRYQTADPAVAYIDGTQAPMMTWFAGLFGALFCLASAGAAVAVFADRSRKARRAQPATA